MAVVAIALGSNLTSNDASLEKNLASALTLLDQMDGLSVSCASRWFRTPAYPAGSGPDFVNGAALIESQLEPHQILACLHEVEEHFGRSRLTRWAPRVLDLDLLFVGPTVLPDRPTVIDWMKIDRGKAQTVTPPHLILPHPRLQERAFVLVPLLDIAPEWAHPILGVSVAEMVAALPSADLKHVHPLATGSILPKTR